MRIRRLLRKHLVVPETKPVSQLLEEFQQGRSHMAMVVDEFGTIAGLLTVEDVLEQIVGPIQDEYDEKAEPPRILEATEVELDGATGRIRRSENATVSALQTTDTLSWTQTDEALPLPLD